MSNLLFVCLHNAGRSQMSQSFFERAARPQDAARSAGTQPAEEPNPTVVEAMGELGIDISARKPRKLTREDAEWADVVVTMGCGDECPYIPGKRYIDWELEDPSRKDLAEVRKIRDEISGRVDRLIDELGSGPSSGG